MFEPTILLKVDFLNNYNLTKTFDSNFALYWEESETNLLNKKCGKSIGFYLPFWKNIATRHHFLVNWVLVLAGNSNVVEITKESFPYSKNLPLRHYSQWRNVNSSKVGNTVFRAQPQSFLSFFEVFYVKGRFFE